ncbi:MAG TPA: aldolase/citrate lyase family protein [Stellaceae bacterium]|nr:aldolase/citrate lyase family protein [Stellaceae bacterium]
MASTHNPARARLERGELSLGVGIRVVRTGEIAKMMQSAGFDWLWIDLEHGPHSLDQASQISLAALDAGITPLVRVPEGQFDMATRALDGGAWGIVMPHVDTVEEAREVVDRLKYPPLGHRSSGGMLPHFGYQAMNGGDAARAVNAEVLLTVMLETPKGIANADAIAAVPGVDVLLIGTGDLTLELGISGNYGDPRVIAAYETVIAACRRHNKWPGMGGVGSDEYMLRFIKMGMRMILAGGDINFLLAGAGRRASTLRAAL